VWKVARDAELDRLKAEQDRTYQRQQEAFQTMKRKQEEQHALYEQQQAAWNRRKAVGDELNREYERLQASRKLNDEVWGEYQRVRDYNNSRISALKPQADSAYRNMVSAFERASTVYNSGDKAAAPGYSAEGKNYQAILQSLNAEISSLGVEIKSAKARAESVGGGRTDGSAFSAAKARFQALKSEHTAIQSKFKSVKSEYDRAKATFKSAQAAHKKAKEAFQVRLATLRAEKASREAKNRNMLMVVSGEIGYMDGKMVKIKPKDDGSGKVDIYFGGLDPRGDGIGHGHIVVDGCQVVYMRQPWKDKKNPKQIDIDFDRDISI
jgi:hypothetical protein